MDSLFTPAELVSITRDYRGAGMPAGLIAFCYDSGGNTFCFDADRLVEGATDAGTIWFFDHDALTVTPVALSFDAWLAMFVTA